MLKKKFKKVWFDNALWRVVNVISPNKFDDFLILDRILEDEVHEGGVRCHDIISVDAHNQEFYPDSPKVRKIMQEWIEISRHTEELRKKCRKDLEREWLDLFAF
jgi:hypothetical protein